MAEDSSALFTELTASIVASYVAHNHVDRADISKLITSTHAALSRLGAGEALKAPEPLVPPVSIRKSVTPDFLISLEDGKRYKSLKRHLSGRGMTPADYRIKWGLSADYPMVSPNYAKQRSELAKALGLGQQRRRPATTKVEAVAEPKAPSKRGRKPKAKSVPGIASTEAV